MTAVVLFSGFGSKYHKRDRDLFDRYPDLAATAENLLGRSVRDRVCSHRADRFFDSLDNQAAVYTVNAMKYRARCEDGLVPDVLLGHDLGEYNALQAAGVFDFGTGLRLVRLRAEITEGVAGAMTVVLGLTAEEIRTVLAGAGLSGIALASLTTPWRTALAGLPVDLGRAEEVLFEAGAYDVRRVPVRSPFHSPLMAGAADVFHNALAAVSFALPRVPVVANCTARPYGWNTAADHLSRQICQPVRWRESIGWVARRCPEAVYTAVGDQELMRRILRRISAESAAAIPGGAGSAYMVRSR
jgi:trans-AT polyketide synthase/acyltransferase/oxidoreductase domain-containing protein